MARVNCSASTCVNNIDGLCSARAITVLGNGAVEPIGTQCRTFATRDFVNAVRNATNLNIGGALAQMVQGTNQHDIRMTPGVNCEAKRCVYNESGICGAGDIAISGNNARTSENTECATFTDNL